MYLSLWWEFKKLFAFSLLLWILYFLNSFKTLSVEVSLYLDFEDLDLDFLFLVFLGFK